MPAGRQTSTALVFENDTIHALKEIIPDLYKGHRVKKIVRNVEGYFTKATGKNKYFEIDAIAITRKRVFVIETKISFKKEDVDRLIMLLENFHQFKFTDPKLHKLLRKKQVHGGFSYIFDYKIKKEDALARRASKYAQDQKLLTIPNLLSHKSKPKQIQELRSFRQQQ